ncbi:MAG: NifB/NifX family molybdenum-iron cluster-binding protein [Bacteroidetes bacterium]|nr:NifB/NifX family molybdenum-iron cluster-binding protein [Bacteroidota bacterium]MBU1116461.1 NifB/NifX family molybdenum-iron cluster-binding protein [Bacteroidota bacterium]MBU1800041.1 NifB/NifX family molybdenum-iron cluster-binding protein [Bacteroidota bacterium]
MEIIIVPLFGSRISPRIDYAEHFKILTVENGKIQKIEFIKIITNNRLERINRLIRLKPDIIICNGITERCYVELTKSNIKIIPWIQGELEEALQNYFSGYLRENGKHRFGNKFN